jgi:HEAT repeat protein
VRALHGLLAHPREFVRRKSAYGLGGGGDRSAKTLRLLGSMLKAKSADERIAALKALADIAEISESARVLAPLAKQLLAALDDPDEDVASWVPDTLAYIGWRPRQFIEFALERVDPPHGKPRYGMLPPMVEMLGKIDPAPYLPALLRILRKSEGPHPDFIGLFGRMGPAAAAAIPDLERFATGDFALHVGGALLRIDGRKDVLDVIARHLPEAPDEMAGVICEIGPAAAPLAGALARVIDARFDEPDWDLMWALSDALAAIESTEPVAIRALRKTLSHESGRIKGAALRGLRKAGPAARAALPDLRRLAGKMTGESRRMVRETIRAIERPTN